MKKNLVILMVLALAASVFAQPVANVNVVEVNGSASVTWGVDFDNNDTGFKNETEAKIVLNMIGEAEQKTSGDGIWAELVLKTDDLKFEFVKNNAWVGYERGDGVRIDTAKLHFGPVYVGILADNTQVGELKLPRALNNEHFMIVNPVGPVRKPGIVVGFNHDIFSLALDLRNQGGAGGDDNNGQYQNDYAMRFVAKTTPIEDLEAVVGFAMAFDKPDDPLVREQGLGASVTYKLTLNDSFYLKPAIGYATPLQKWDLVENKAVFHKGDLGIGLLFGFAGDPCDVGLDIFKNGTGFIGTAYQGAVTGNGLAKWNDGKVDFLDKEQAGVSVATMIDLDTEKAAIPLAIDFNLGKDLVKDLGAIAFVRTADVAEFADNWALGFGASYKLAVDPAELTFKTGLLRTSFIVPAIPGLTEDKSVAWTQLEVGTDIGGLINNTTFTVSYVSGNLTPETGEGYKAGHLNFRCKIAF